VCAGDYIFLVPPTLRRLLPDGTTQYYGDMNLGFTEMAFIFFIALIIFGPKKLPQIGRQLGNALNEFKRASNEFKAQIEAEIGNLDTEPANDRNLQVLPPAEPPQGVVQSHGSEDLHELPPPTPEQLTSKAPDA
jgi:sec-independent protein translocase protein TatB